ncbi:MAG: hypothetical protein U0984_06075 [Prosthecobacter sp.]|nr:hypothetical protein [Prosthecobacter sp.]
MNSIVSNALTITAHSLAQPMPMPRNFLFILPHRATPEDHALIFTIASSMTGLGYVYVASADQATMEDKGQIRYLPFRTGQFPSFGVINAVFVLRDREVATAALAEYRGAEAFLLEPRSDVPNHTAPAFARKVQNIGALISFPA